jgi:hypothetical protein
MRYRSLILVVFLVGFHSVSIARDVDGKYAQGNPGIHAWMEGLRSGKGPCCSDADGTAISDVDWKTTGDPARPYKVFIDDAWVPVEATAVITEPNKIGKTMVWPIRGYQGTTVRCFMPGSFI